MNLKPLVKDNLFCFDKYQVREIALLVVNTRVNDSIINYQNCVIKDQDSLISNLDTTVSNQASIISNQATLIEHRETLAVKQGDIADMKLEGLKSKNIKQKKKFVVVLSILVAIIILK